MSRFKKLRSEPALAASDEVDRTILLPTTLCVVSNSEIMPNLISSNNVHTASCVCVLYDTASARSFVRKKVIKKLELQPVGNMEISIQTINGSKTEEKIFINLKSSQLFRKERFVLLR